MTAVIGPNGSGKSNITDAMKWVLGESNVRNLRGQKAEDIIFSGTEKRRPMGAAEVKTAIAGSDKAIGYLGFNYLGGGVAEIAFNGIMPTYENIKLDLYELHRHLYFYTIGEPSKGAKAFIDFVQGPEGQKIAAEEGFIPI